MGCKTCMGYRGDYCLERQPCGCICHAYCKCVYCTAVSLVETKEVVLGSDYNYTNEQKASCSSATQKFISLIKVPTPVVGASANNEFTANREQGKRSVSNPQTTTLKPRSSIGNLFNRRNISKVAPPLTIDDISRPNLSSDLQTDNGNDDSYLIFAHNINMLSGEFKKPSPSLKKLDHGAQQKVEIPVGLNRVVSHHTAPLGYRKPGAKASELGLGKQPKKQKPANLDLSSIHIHMHMNTSIALDTHQFHHTDSDNNTYNSPLHYLDNTSALKEAVSPQTLGTNFSPEFEQGNKSSITLSHDNKEEFFGVQEGSMEKKKDSKFTRICNSLGFSFGKNLKDFIIQESDKEKQLRKTKSIFSNTISFGSARKTSKIFQVEIVPTEPKGGFKSSKSRMPLKDILFSA